MHEQDHMQPTTRQKHLPKPIYVSMIDLWVIFNLLNWFFSLLKYIINCYLLSWFCFSQIYTAGCDKEYRLNESGNINVPPGAADLFCNGPCFGETQLMLDCVEKLLSNFNFHNKASVKDIRKALNSGCSYTSQRGIYM